MRRWRLFLWIWILWLGGLAALPAPLSAQAAGAAVCWSGVDGIINPAAADYLARAVAEAEAGCQVLVIRLNTPGGLTSSTWRIGEALLNARVPTVVYVSPQGANAGSAGVFITYAAHLAAMAPNTNIGAAHPVAGGGEDIGDDLRDKITNDAVARITTWARTRGRNVEWAEQAVRQSVSVGSDTALEQNIINMIAIDDSDLLRQLDGLTVPVAGGERTLATVSAPRREIGMSWIETILHMLGDPSIATLLLSLGSLGIYFELATPGVGVGGVAGIICLGLGMYGLSILPVNIVGAGLLLVAFVMFAVDIFATNHGALTAGGIAAFVVGALLLIDADAAPGVAVSKGIIFGIALGLALVMALILMMVTRMRRLPAISGVNPGLIGEAATVRSPLVPQGTVWTQGALWQARSADPLEVGDEAEIIAVEGLTLVVRRRPLGAALEAPARGNGGM